MGLWHCPSGEPRPHSGPFGHSEARRPQGSRLRHRPVSGGLFRGRGPLPGSAAQDHSRTLRQQGEWIPRRPCWFRVLSTPPLLPPQVPMQLNAGQALGVEVLCTFQMVFTVFSVEEQRRRENPEPGNLAIGLAHSAGVLLGVRSPHGTCLMVFRIKTCWISIRPGSPAAA